jgi:hypothetical protein
MVTTASRELVGGMSGTAIALIVAAAGAAAITGIVVAANGDEGSPSQ